MQLLRYIFPLAILALLLPPGDRDLAAATLQFSIGQAEITPDVSAPQPVWMAGYYHGRAATGVHDPLFARGMLLSDGTKKIAVVSLDLIGWSYPSTVRIRKQLPNIDYVIICSTHNHQGPDTIGIWGESPIKRGSSDAYNAQVESTVVDLVRKLEPSLQDVTAEFGKVDRPDLVQDTRLPNVIDPTIRVLRFRSAVDQTIVGLLVQGTTHPESLGSKNTLITADFPCFLQRRLEDLYHCPTVYVSGAIGGLLTPPENGITQRDGTAAKLGTFAYAKAYGETMADAVRDALDDGHPIKLTPLCVERQEVAIPIDNPLYRLARSLNVIRRVSYEWTGGPYEWGDRVTRAVRPERAAAITEIAAVCLGSLRLLCIPGELYPELVNGDIPDPVEKNVDFPEAAVEPSIAQLLGDTPYMIFGLANDEIGYIVPKRQWDRDPPYAYGRGLPQYGEINSCSYEVAPIVMETLGKLCKHAQKPASRQ